MKSRKIQVTKWKGNWNDNWIMLMLSYFDNWYFDNCYFDNCSYKCIYDDMLLIYEILVYDDKWLKYNWIRGLQVFYVVDMIYR